MRARSGTAALRTDRTHARSVLDTRFSRDGLPAKRLERLKDVGGSRTRAKLSAALETVLDKLGNRTPESGEKLNLHADTLGKVAKAAAVVHAWGTNPNVAVIIAGDLRGEAMIEPEPEPIDIE